MQCMLCHHNYKHTKSASVWIGHIYGWHWVPWWYKSINSNYQLIADCYQWYLANVTMFCLSAGTIFWGSVGWEVSPTKYNIQQVSCGRGFFFIFYHWLDVSVQNFGFCVRWCLHDYTRSSFILVWLHPGSIPSIYIILFMQYQLKFHSGASHSRISSCVSYWNDENTTIFVQEM